MCKKMGLSQQGLADLMDIKRGKVAGYFYETQARPDFHQKLSEQFNLNLGKFLTREMNESNFETFFYPIDKGVMNDPEESYGKPGALETLQKAKSAETEEERNRLIDEAIIIYDRLMETNSKLKDELMEALRKGKK